MSIVVGHVVCGRATFQWHFSQVDGAAAAADLAVAICQDLIFWRPASEQLEFKD